MFVRRSDHGALLVQRDSFPIQAQPKRAAGFRDSGLDGCSRMH